MYRSIDSREVFLGLLDSPKLEIKPAKCRFKDFMHQLTGAKNIRYEYTNHKAFKGIKTIRKLLLLGSPVLCTVHAVTTTSVALRVGPVRSCLCFKEGNY